MAVENIAARSGNRRRRARLSGVVARLTVANALAAATGFITGPLLARALGASGRGDLQAIIVPLQLTPIVLSFGITAYAYRTLPRGQTVDEVIPSLGLPLLVIGLIAATAAVPIADALAAGRETVRSYLIVGFMATPFALLIMLLSSSLAALERWRAVVAMSVIPFAVPFVAIVGLAAFGQLTVATAAAATIFGSLLAVVPGLPLLVSVRKPAFRPSLVREGVSFGMRSWLGGLAQIANGRLDQVLMITLVPSGQLGLYAVATTISGAFGLVAGAVCPPLMARIGSGERHLMPQAVRMTVTVTIGLNLAVALVTPILLPLLFGPEFRAATPMALVLLAASVPLAGASVLSTALQADGVPLIPSIGEGIALIVTVVGLIVLLPPLQGMGAAVVSLAAYGASFTFQLVMARRRIGAPLSAFVLPSRADVHWLRSRLTGFTPRFGAER
jgi:O-antigen/teichoic acid export membrane protein